MFRYILISVIFLGFILRIYAINFGFPFIESRPDETIGMHIALGYGKGDFNPHNFHWPSLFSYIIFILYGIYISLGFLINHFYTWRNVIDEVITNPTNFLLISRLISVFSGTFTVYFTYKIGKLFFNETIGFIASIFLAFTYLHVRDSHFGVPDILMVFFVMVTIYWIGQIYQVPSLDNYVYSGLFYGLATSVKYNAFLLLIPILIIHYFIIREQKSKYFNKNIILLFLISLTAFTIGTPFWILDFPTFFSDASFEFKHLIEGHQDIILGRGWWYHLNFSLWYGMGGPLLILSLCGLIYCFVNDYRKSTIIFSFPIVYYFVAGSGYTVFVRYILPVVPFAAISAAILVNIIFLKILDVKKITKYNRYLIKTFIIIIIIFPSFTNVIKFNKILGNKDNRVIVSEWIEENISADSSLGFVGNKYAKIQLPKEYQLNNIKLLDYLIIEKSPLDFYNCHSDNLTKIIENEYHKLKIFRAQNGNNSNKYDQQDAFYVPYAGFSGVIRPGPDYLIYKRK